LPEKTLRPAAAPRAGLALGGSFSARFGTRRRRSIADRESFYDRGRAAFNSSNDGAVVRGDHGPGNKSVLVGETIDQPHLTRAQNLVREGEEIPERPQQARALNKIRFQVTGTDWGLQLEDPTGEFFHPH
jgi:hypothetical protein